MATASVGKHVPSNRAPHGLPLEFGLLLGCGILLGTLVYWPLREFHHGWALESSGHLLTLFDESLGIALVDGQGQILDQPRHGSRWVSVTRSTLDLTQVGVVLLPSLWLASPAGRRAPGRGILAFALLLLAQCLGLSCAALASIYDNSLASLVRDLASHTGLVVPVLLWGGMLHSWRAFSATAKRELRARPPQSAAPERNDACPCGSGLKYKHCCASRGSVKT
jgi:hypothetical protein